jgi:hypothetical protein
MDTPADRLKAARLARGYRTAKAAAEAMNSKVATYTQHETPGRIIPEKKARLYADFFRTTPEWILYGISPAREATNRYPLPMLEISERSHKLVRLGVAPLPVRLEPDVCALRICSNKILGPVEGFTLIYFKPATTNFDERLLESLCVVCLKDETITLGTLLRGSLAERFHVMQMRGDPLLDQSLLWAAKVLLIAP